MRILQLCNKSPWPPKEGGSIAMNAITQSLLMEGHQVKVIAMNTNKYPVRTEDIPEDYKYQTGIALGDVDLNIRPLHAFGHLFSKHSYIVRRFESKDFRNILRNTLVAKKFDVIQLETLYLTPYIKDIRYLSEAKIVLRSHNIEHQIWQRYAANTNNPLKKVYLKILAAELKNYEVNHINNYDGILPITDVDREFYEQYSRNTKIMTLPFALKAIDLKNHMPFKTQNSLFHIGSMDWLPNQEGIMWFLDNVWPEVYRDFPDLTFSLAGRNMPEWIQKRNDPGLVIDGEVENAYKYMQSKNIMIVPLFSGSGIRIKILEGMLNKNVVITTSIGAEGIDATDGEHLLIADDKDAFKRQIQYCMDNPEASAKIGENAFQLVKEHYNLKDNAHKLTAFYQKLMENNS
ncbi:MAG: glycosyltransferase family 4 protein [Bacteroidales bacterium]